MIQVNVQQVKHSTCTPIGNIVTIYRDMASLKKKVTTGIEVTSYVTSVTSTAVASTTRVDGNQSDDKPYRQGRDTTVLEPC